MRKIVAFFKENKKWNVVLWSAIALFLVISLLIINEKENTLRIKKISVTILPESELSFLDSNAIINVIKGIEPDMILVGARLENIKIDEMEADLEANPFVEEADISVDLSGRMKIKVLQRSPVLRVFNNKGQSYYVSKNGYKIPRNDEYSARVIVANGNITESLADSIFAKTKVLKDLYQIAQYCSKDKFWDAQIEQLYVDNYNDILLIPKVGNHTIVFGSAEGLDGKFTRLKEFYFKGLNNIGWNKYKSINVKYDNQIIAEKNGLFKNASDTAK
ncbi:MAG: cell division protein FtsQ [bacterium]|nr:cell division protein FtsQ [bacterium]